MKILIFALGFSVFSTSVWAKPITFSGAELAALPGVTFPTGVRTIQGDSLRIDPSAPGGVFISLPLDQFDVDARDINVKVSFTRFLNDNDEIGYSPFLYLGDGLNLFGGQFSDGASDIGSFLPRRDELIFDGVRIGTRDILGGSLGGIPIGPIGAPFLAAIRIQATSDNTLVTGSINNIMASLIVPTRILFDPTNGGPSLIFANNTILGNFQIDSVSISSGPGVWVSTPEPDVVGGMAFGLMALGLGVYRRRKK